jgi:cell division septation protein DedD
MNNDRRQHPRYIPDSALLVSLGQSKRGFLKDVSESGMAFDGLLPSSGNNVVYLAFDLPDGGGAIEAVAEVVWTCESLHRTGVRFLELAEASRRQLREWISSHVFALSDKASEEEEYVADYRAVEGSAELRALASPVVSRLIPDPTLSEPVPSASVPRPERKKARLGVLAVKKIIHIPHAPASVGVVLAVLFLSTACVSLGYYLPGIILGHGLGRGPERASAPLSVASTASLASNPPGAPIALNNVAVNRLAVNQSAAAKPSINEPVNEVANHAASVAAPPAHGGFILQVAAMAQAVNAAKLIEKLRQKHFPAFLPDRGSDTLYRVEVGPYENMDYARTVAGDLKSAGFPVVLKHRSAQPDSN